MVTLKKSLFYVMLMLTLTLPLCFVGCFGGSVTKDGVRIPNIDNSTDLKSYSPTENDNFSSEETPYTSNYLCLVTDINGYFSVETPFVLDETDENKRVWDNLYLYEDDQFWVTSKDNKYIWASLNDNSNTYLKTLKEDGEDIRVDVLKSGIYKLVLDITTMKFDFAYKSEIETPVYAEIKNCEIYSVRTKWQEMQKVGDEFVINNFYVETGKNVSFFSKIHTSNYKTTILSGLENKYICKTSTKRTSNVLFMIGGTYNIYINAKTYVVRVELINADDAEYSACLYQDKNLVSLTKGDKNYIFTTNHTTKDYSDHILEEVPKIYTSGYKAYNLNLTEESLNYIKTITTDSGKVHYYFKEAGTYKLTVNLKDFTIDVVSLLE